MKIDCDHCPGDCLGALRCHATNRCPRALIEPLAACLTDTATRSAAGLAIRTQRNLNSLLGRWRTRIACDVFQCWKFDWLQSGAGIKVGPAKQGLHRMTSSPGFQKLSRYFSAIRVELWAEGLGFAIDENKHILSTLYSCTRIVKFESARNSLTCRCNCPKGHSMGCLLPWCFYTKSMTGRSSSLGSWWAVC